MAATDLVFVFVFSFLFLYCVDAYPEGKIILENVCCFFFCSTCALLFGVAGIGPVIQEGLWEMDYPSRPLSPSVRSWPYISMEAMSEVQSDDCLTELFGTSGWATDTVRHTVQRLGHLFLTELFGGSDVKLVLKRAVCGRDRILFCTAIQCLILFSCRADRLVKILSWLIQLLDTTGWDTIVSYELFGP